MFFSTTSIYFEGQGGQELGQYGKSKDHRPDLRQMVWRILSILHGCPRCLVNRGLALRATSFAGAWGRALASALRGSEGYDRCRPRTTIPAVTIAALESKELDIDYILGARMRSTKEVSDRVLSVVRAVFAKSSPSVTGPRNPSPLKVKQVYIYDRRYVVCLNEEQRCKDTADREAIVAHLRERFARGATRNSSATRAFEMSFAPSPVTTSRWMKPRRQKKRATTDRGLYACTWPAG